MKTPNPVDLPELWDTFVLSGKRSPGICKFPSIPRVEGWEKQVPKGTTGGITVHNNQPPIDFEVEIYLWKDENVDHFARWEEWKTILMTPIKKNNPKALDIYHPQLDGIGVRSVVPSTRAEYVPDGKGGATVKWKFLEYRPPKPLKAQAPNGAVTVKKKSDPNADLKAEVADLTKKFKEAG